MSRRRHGRAAPIAWLLGAAAWAGCARDHARITPTTTGTDLRAMPRGSMTPQPFPGSSLAHAGLLPRATPTMPARPPKLDPAATPTRATPIGP